MNNSFTVRAAAWIATGAAVCMAVWVSQSAAPCWFLLVPFFAGAYDNFKKNG